jgi:hypothetical protein
MLRFLVVALLMLPGVGWGQALARCGSGAWDERCVITGPQDARVFVSASDPTLELMYSISHMAAGKPGLGGSISLCESKKEAGSARPACIWIHFEDAQENDEITVRRVGSAR